MACRIARTAEWSLRIQHELKGKDGCFITLTYENMPPNGSLVKEDLVKFMKRLRKRLNLPIKFYACGEYGEINERPHYHLIIIGWNPDDLVSPTNNGKNVSPFLYKVWPEGFNSVGSITPKSVAYVCGYVRKKLTGQMAKEKYGDRIPPFSLMSKGLGKEYVIQNAQRLNDKGYVTVRGSKVPIPRYYKEYLKKTMEDYKEKAMERGEILNQKSKELHKVKDLDSYVDYVRLQWSDRRRRKAELDAKEKRPRGSL